MNGTPWPAQPAPTADGTAADSSTMTETYEEEEAPVGTVFFMILFLLVMVGLWITVYLMLLER
jgi:hypothetical protein